MRKSNDADHLIVGFGYLGKRLSALLQSKSIPHHATSRTAGSSQRQKPNGARLIRVDLDRSPMPMQYQNVWFFCPPNKHEESDIRLQRFLQALQPSKPPQRIVYVSTTGVYGDCQGAWVNEFSAVNPGSARARRRADAENQIMQWGQQHDCEYVILRVAGIYGPNKLPIQRLKDRLPIVAESEAPWSNRIHAEDLTQICYKAMTSDVSNSIYNVADNEPGNMTQYLNSVADICGLPRPPLVSLDQHDGQPSPGMLSYLRESRRIDNAKLLTELEYTLRYPSLETGLPNAVAESR